MLETQKKHTKGRMWMLAGIVALLLLALQAPALASAEEDGETQTQSLLPGGKQIYNLLLIGSDRRDDSWNGNSDVMILITIQEEKEKLVMTSFMRDLYANIPGYGVHKLNYAFAGGGAEKLIATLEDNYQLSIDNYMIVDFDSMAAIVDYVGGAEITVTDAECTVLNQYLDSMGASDSRLYGGGTYVLNGYQAVAYMRIRYVGNSDYQRTQRQRDVLSSIFSEVRNLGTADLMALAAQILPQIEHDIDPVSLLKLTAALPVLADYELEENRIPYDDLYYSQNEMLVPDFPATIERLHELID